MRGKAGIAAGLGLVAAVALLTVLHFRDRESGEREARARALDEAKSRAAGPVAEGPTARAQLPTAESLVADFLAGRLDQAGVCAALGKLQPAAAIVALRRRWGEIGDAAVRRALVEALAKGPATADWLDLAMTDADAAVREWAAARLRPIAFRDCLKDPEGYKDWHARLGGLPLEQVRKSSAREFVLLGMAAGKGDVRAVAAEVRVNAAGDGAGLLAEAGVLQALEGWITWGEPAAVEEALALIPLFPGGDALLQRLAMPLLKREGLEATVLHGLGRPGNEWAISAIAPLLSSPDEGISRAAAQALAEIGDERGVYLMADAILADPTGQLAGRLGPAGLAKLAGVTEAEASDVTYWRAWRDQHKPDDATRSLAPRNR